MSFPSQSLPPDVIAALEQGKPIEAIKRLRRASGLGLAEAKSAIEAHLRSGAAQGETFRPFETAHEAPDGGRVLPAEAVEALQRGDAVAAVRILRERTGLGLKAAKDRIEAARHQVGHRIEGPPPQPALSRRDLAPGEVPRTNTAFWWVVILAAVIAAYYSFGR